MRITLAHIGSPGGANAAFDAEVEQYAKKLKGFANMSLASFRSEDALLKWIEEQKGRTPIIPVLLDSRGKQTTSEELAKWIGKRRDDGSQHLLFAIGPADGWSDAARDRVRSPGMLLSLGPMTLAHSLARLVLAEQLYRAWAILTGHPYHRGH